MEVIHQADGDYHVVIGDNDGHNLVTEVIPQIPLALPEKGERVSIWGIVRFDAWHNWWELHPVIGCKQI